ncbi:uncharacterized protein LOC129323178 [Prosopis cineraria]|uniref:uncharacterized protein LOC129323178 n=1 Tax=Prosopis cineraria TaxID=364024 RepID=UPI00240FF4A0|nr:uncharacterized protein LOC129323178 [Prosopis cineraria]
MELVAVAATTGIRTIDVLASEISVHSSWPSMQIDSVLVPCRGPFCRPACSSSKSRRRSLVLPIIRSSTRPGVDSSNTTNQDFAVEQDPNSTSRHQLASIHDQALKTTFSTGLVFELGFKGSWDCSEVGSPVVKRFVGDNEERWYMWYHGRPNDSTSDSIGLAVSGDGVHWTRGTQNARSSGHVGCVLNPSSKWWAFDTESIRPSQMVVMSNQLHSAVYWLYYTGYSSEEVNPSGSSTNLIVQNPESVYPKDRRNNGKIFKSLPGLACSQDGRHWARIEGDHHSGAVLDVGTGNDWDSLFIAAPNVVVHSSDDLRMYYHSFDVKTGRYAIGMARSRDGMRWIKLGKIIGLFDDELGVRKANVVRNNGGNYLMAYECVAADGRTSIGVAESPDGLKNWTKIQEEPTLMPLEDDHGWDSEGVGSPCLVQMNNNNKSDEWRLYYAGIGNDGKTGIGMAVSEGSNLRRFRRWE